MWCSFIKWSAFWVYDHKASCFDNYSAYAKAHFIYWNPWVLYKAFYINIGYIPFKKVPHCFFCFINCYTLIVTLWLQCKSQHFIPVNKIRIAYICTLCSGKIPNPKCSLVFMFFIFMDLFELEKKYLQILRVYRFVFP